MANYLVTGIAGFIGSVLARRLIIEGHKVAGIDNLSTGFTRNIPEGTEFIHADCQDPTVYEKLKNIQFDAIFHIAGQSSGEISFDDPVYDLRTNTESTLLLLEYARQNNCERFIYAGTMSVYGIKEDQPVSEEDICIPESFYGVGKLASEHYMRIYQHHYSINSTSLRLFNVYGPGQNMENLRQGMVSIFMSQMLTNRYIHVKGSPDRFRDFIYIDDVVDAFIACLSKPESFGLDINVATGVKTTVKELLDKMINIYGHPVDIMYEGSTAGDIQGIHADITRMRDLLNIKPRYELEHGLKLMLESLIS